jgi:hypothetical protein
MAGRPAIPKGPTKFLNSKRRRIMMTANGKYIVKAAKGTVYAPKARYVTSPGGTERSIGNSSVRVPTAIRPKVVRKVRANRGKARGAYAGVKAGALGALFSPKKARGRGRPRKYLVSPGGNFGLAALFGGKAVRKTRANAGGKRGPRVAKSMLMKNPFAGLI